jgi:hypothetical protein
MTLSTTETRGHGGTDLMGLKLRLLGVLNAGEWHVTGFNLRVLRGGEWHVSGFNLRVLRVLRGGELSL